jgi:phosphatidylserine/phosphatidylglycerophosphate/cardiolipin synthase-like enzyme
VGDDPAGWFLSRHERPWTEGNLVVPLVHGAHYFRRLHDELRALVPGDRVFFTDWRGDADEQLLPDGPSVGELLCDVARRGVGVRGLLWRSHSDHASFSAQQNQRLGTELNEAGAEALLDQRVRRFGSHHQKMFVIQHRDDPSRDVAFVGGIDLCHGRRDDTEHEGDPQSQPMDKRYGKRAPWHDAVVELHGPVVGDVLATFAERWDDPHPLDRRTPYRMLVQRKARMPRHPQPIEAHLPPPPPAGPHPVQVLRTYGHKRPPFPFARDGERSIARAYLHAFARARSLIYVEDQYLWSVHVANGIAQALRREPELRFIAVVPRYPDADGAVSGPPNRLGQIRAMELLHSAAPGRVGIYDIENAAGVPIYVHAKMCVVDDTWMTCGSDNFNRRSWTNDSEITLATVAPDLARELRTQLWAEHLQLPLGDPSLLDHARSIELWNARAGSGAGRPPRAVVGEAALRNGLRPRRPPRPAPARGRDVTRAAHTAPDGRLAGLRQDDGCSTVRGGARRAEADEGRVDEGAVRRREPVGSERCDRRSTDRDRAARAVPRHKRRPRLRPVEPGRTLSAALRRRPGRRCRPDLVCTDYPRRTAQTS